MSFDARWRELTRSARAVESGPLSLESIARLARTREPEPIPFVSPRVGAALALVAAALTIALAPIVLGDLEPLAKHVESGDMSVPKPPALPAPPSLEAPSYYVAAANAVWKDLRP